MNVGDTITRTGRDRYRILRIRPNGYIDAIGGKPAHGTRGPSASPERNHRTFRPQDVKQVP